MRINIPVTIQKSKLIGHIDFAFQYYDSEGKKAVYRGTAELRWFHQLDGKDMLTVEVISRWADGSVDIQLPNGRIKTLPPGNVGKV